MTDWASLLRGLCNVRCHEGITAQLTNTAWIHAVDLALASLLSKNPSATVFHIGTTSAVTPMLAAKHGCSKVTSITRWPAEAACTRSAIERNGLATVVSVACTESFPREPPHQCDIAIADVSDVRAMGSGVLDSLAHVASSATAAVIVPSRVRLFARAIDASVGRVSGFDLSPFEVYHASALGCGWPSEASTSSSSVPHVPLSPPFALAEFSFGQSKAKHQGSPETGSPPIARQHEFTAVSSGMLSGFLVWVEVDLCDGVAFSQTGDQATKFVFWVEPVPLMAGQRVSVTSEATTLRVSFKVTEPAPRKPATLLPPVELWHFGMLADSLRNESYHHGINRAVSRAAARLGRKPLALEIGAGTGLLSMMAAQAGAEAVAVECTEHLASVGREICSKNGFGQDRLRLLSKHSKEIAAPGDIERAPDVLVFEIFDYTLLGESVIPTIKDLHQRNLIGQDTTLVPFAATIYGVIVEAPTYSNVVRGLNLTDATAFRRVFHEVAWEGTHLLSDGHRPLTPVSRAMSLNFSKKSEMCGELPTNRFLVTVESPGQANAFVFWFHLHIDAEISVNSLMTTAWCQAIQYFDAPVDVQVGDKLEVFAWVAKETRPLFAFRRVRDGPDAEPASPAGGPIPPTLPEWAKQLPAMNARVLELAQKSGAMPGEPLKKEDVQRFREVVEQAPLLGIDASVAQVAFQRSLSASLS